MTFVIQCFLSLCTVFLKPSECRDGRVGSDAHAVLKELFCVFNSVTQSRLTLCDNPGLQHASLSCDLGKNFMKVVYGFYVRGIRIFK